MKQEKPIIELHDVNRESDIYSEIFLILEESGLPLPTIIGILEMVKSDFLVGGFEEDDDGK